MNRLIYDSLAKLLLYPRDDFRSRALVVEKFLRGSHPEMAGTLAPFTARVSELSATQLEELYTRTFDVQAMCCLDVGFVLFGEDYKRGQFLVKLLELCQTYDVDCGTELADHLTNVLPLVARLQEANRDEARDFVERLVLPALQKMQDSFGKENSGNAYASVLTTVQCCLQKDFDIEPGARVIPFGKDLPVLESPALEEML